ncbi:unnamed protein product [Peronospora belbahrii]|uniref:glucan endo-1,3-beta-D-glucosidase n=1 Tax=Peronospora belbahrii TaxID=622444 RepID=A0AAU9L1M1_9STRA|nr:unnamed protein product [Peronospora belbahrii]
MVCTSYKTIFAMLAAMAFGLTEANLGICYAPWNGLEVTKERIETDCRKMLEYTTFIRTFEVNMIGLNIIDVVSSVNGKIAVGVQMAVRENIPMEIKGVCDGYKKSPDTVMAVYVGNENLQIDGSGQYTVDEVIGYIKTVKECTGGNVKVGTVQTISYWLGASDAKRLYDECTSPGVNIYPFFTSSLKSNFDKFLDQINQLENIFGQDNLFDITEVGFPTNGPPSSQGVMPSLQESQLLLDNVFHWSIKMNKTTFWFQYLDQLKTFGGPDFEMYFGIVNVDRTPKLVFPKSSSPIPSPAPNVPAPAPGNPPPSGSPATESPVAILVDAASTPAPDVLGPAPESTAPKSTTSDSPATGSPSTGSPSTGSPSTGSPSTGSPASGSADLDSYASGSASLDSPASELPASGSPPPGSPPPCFSLPESPGGGGGGGGTFGITCSPPTGSPASGSPPTGSPASGSPATDSPASGSPATGSPATGSPSTGSPSTGSPDTGSPASGSADLDSYASGSADLDSYASGSASLDFPASGSPPPCFSPPESPVSGSPALEIPATGSPVTGSPPTGSPALPVSGSPATDSPVSGSPATDSPVSGSPVLGSPASGSPPPCSPAPGIPDSSTPCDFPPNAENEDLFNDGSYGTKDTYT